MYQALYRKWRPRTFDDVVGQSHITETLKRQVESGRLSHAYLFTGSRGTGKTTCAKLLSRAVNCLHPEHGNPCNRCDACVGIENGSILDVLELDAASNNGVDQVRALRDEAVYTPAAVRKRVYIVDEVHMLSTPAFNALLKILEEPPEHLMFILATTELHKVPATIKSRCQQFSFRRILPGDIAGRLSDVAGREGIDLTAEGAMLLARLADGGLRDALSLLDQCAGPAGPVDEGRILDTLGLAGGLEAARLMDRVARRDTQGALEDLARLYEGGKDISAVLGELSALARDLLLRKTAPRSGGALLSGSWDEATLKNLSQAFTAPRLVWTLDVLQRTLVDLPRSSSRRTDAELCLLRLCDESLDDSPQGLLARLDRLEALLAGGVPVGRSASPQPPPPQEPEAAPVPCDAPEASLPGQPAEPVAAGKPAPERPVSHQRAERPSAETDDGAFWRSLAAALREKAPRNVRSYLVNPELVQGRLEPGTLTLWTEEDLVKEAISRPAVQALVKELAQARLGSEVQVRVKLGKPPRAAAAPAAGAPDRLEELLAVGRQYDNITIKE